MRISTFIPAFLLAILSFPAVVRSQITQDWARAYSVSSAANAHIATDASGNMYIAGNSSSTGYTLIKYTSAGAQQWAINAAPGTSQAGSGVVGIGIDKTGNVYLVSNGASGILVAAFNSSGVQLWATVIQSPGRSPSAKVMAVDPSGDVFIGGQILTSSTVTIWNYMTVKVTGGVQQWMSSFEGSANQFSYITGIAADASGNAYVTGTSIGAHTYITRTVLHTLIRHDTTFDMTTIKYGPTGTALWTNTYNAGFNDADFGFSVAVDPSSGNAYALGQSEISGGGLVGDLIAYSSAGAQLWLDQSSTQPNNNAIAVDPSGNIITACAFSGLSVSKYLSTGALSWSYTNASFPITNGELGDYLSMALDKGGNCYVTGPTPSFTNYTTAELSSGGTPAWSITYSTVGSGGSSGIAIYTPISRAGQIVYPEINVTGTSANSTNFTTVQYQYHMENELASSNPKAPTGLNSALTTSSAARLSAFPNPFRGATTIAYAIPNDSHVTIQIFDQSGHSIAVLFDGNQNAGAYTLPYTASRLAPGIYHYRIIATSPKGGFIQTKQMLIL
jgi:hypothetical protein